MNDDLISRQAVLDGIISIAHVKAKSDAQKSLMSRVIFFTEHLPPVNPKETNSWKCSQCGSHYTYQFAHCPTCGAIMTESEKNK